MLQHFQKNNIHSLKTNLYQTQFGLFKIMRKAGNIVQAEFVDAALSGLFQTIELNQSTFKEYLQPNGTSFQKEVWDALRKIPFGSVASYEEIACAINKPKAARAVATAIACNPIAYLIPCHRVIRKNGEYGQYRWGIDLKRKLLEWEASNT